jgi:hypothetical protein
MRHEQTAGARACPRWSEALVGVSIHKHRRRSLPEAQSHRRLAAGQRRPSRTWPKVQTRKGAQAVRRCRALARSRLTNDGAAPKNETKRTARSFPLCPPPSDMLCRKSESEAPTGQNDNGPTNVRHVVPPGTSLILRHCRLDRQRHDRTRPSSARTGGSMHGSQLY